MKLAEKAFTSNRRLGHLDRAPGGVRRLLALI